MKSFKVIALLSSVIMMSGCVIHVNAQSANVQLEEELVLSASDLNELEIETGSGEVSITGLEGATEIKVLAQIHTTKDKNYELTLTQSGKKAFIVAQHDSTSGFWNGNSPSIDLIITVPKNMTISVDDGSGALSISGINGFVNVEDGSGALFINDIDGDLIVDDGSGELEIKNISGDIDVTDGSGSLFISDIGGTVNVDDGSGEMTVQHIGGNVTINDGSGSIEVIDAGGLKITDSGSGGLKVKDVKGNFDIDS